VLESGCIQLPATSVVVINLGPVAKGNRSFSYIAKGAFMKLVVIGLEDELFNEIQRDIDETMIHESNAARGSVDVSAWAGQILEAHLASRRLPRVRLSVYAPYERKYVETADA